MQLKCSNYMKPVSRDCLLNSHYEPLILNVDNNCDINALSCINAAREVQSSHTDLVILKHAGIRARNNIRVGSSGELCNMSTIMVKVFADWGKVLAQVAQVVPDIHATRI